MLDWSRIDDVFLDMDGTLLDLHFDNHFWLEHVPQRYAEAKGLDLASARAQLHAGYKDILGSLQWYCVDHWSRSLGLDIALLKEEVAHLIQVHPHVPEFLDLVAKAGKRRVLVTNAHQKSIALKMRKTALDHHFERIICSHELGCPKEDPLFWHKLNAVMPYEPSRTLFVDDSPSVLAAARRHGVGMVMAVLAPDSQQPSRPAAADGELSINDFSALLPGLRDYVGGCR